MKLKILQKHENRRPLSVALKCAVVLMLLLCAIGIAAAANGNATDIGNIIDGNATDIGNIIDKKEIVKAGADVWTKHFDDDGYLLLGSVLLVTIISIIIGLLGGTAVMNFGKVSGNNDTHATGKSMIGTAVLSVVMMVLGFAFIGMVFAAW